MTGLKAFMQALTQGRKRAEQEHLAPLTAHYAALLKRAGDQAATRLREKAALTASDWQPPPEGTLYTGITVPAALKAAQAAALAATVKQALTGTGIRYDPAAGAVRDLLAQTAAWTGRLLDETVIPQLRTIIERAFADGTPVREAAAEIRATFAEFAPWQGEMLARSTLNMLGNGGQQYAVTAYNARAAKAKEPVFETKRWLTAGDAKVRDTHRAAQGQTVPVGQPFTVGGSTLMFPGDPQGALAEVLNCRCVLTYQQQGAAVASAYASPMARKRKQQGMTAAATGSTSLPLSTRDAAWDAGAARKSLQPGQYARAHFWRDPEGDPATLAAYKLPFARNEGGQLVAVWRGVTAAAQRLPSTQIPSADVAGVQRKIAAYYRKAARKYGDDQIKPPWMAFIAAVTITVGDETQRQEVAWEGVLVLEGVATDDNSLTPRVMLPGSIGWRELPLPFMAQTVTAEGHDGAEIAGRIDRIWREDAPEFGKGATAIRGEGAFTTEFGIDEIAPMVGDGTLRGVSVDLVGTDWVLVDAKTLEPVADDALDEETLFAGGYMAGLRSGEIGATTLCPVQALSDAQIALVASSRQQASVRMPDAILLTEGVLTASAAGLAPLAPPAAWFTQPEADKLTPLTVSDEGQVYGHIAPWDSCHTGRNGTCFQPPPSPSGYAYFNNGEVVCADGSRVGVGQITLGTDHASLSADWRQAKAHYENTGTAVADVRASDGIFGIWVAGALRPHVSAAQVRELRGSKPSGDWRQITYGGPLELIGALEVNVPGYPVPRLQLVASARHPEGEPVALLGGGIVDDGFDRELALLAARAEGMDGLLALAESVAS